MSLSTDLQAAISQLQTDHSSLVTAVRSRNGVSPATNAAIAGKLAGDVTIQAKVDTLRSAVAAAGSGTESLSLDFVNEIYQSGVRSLTRGNSFSDHIAFSRSSSGTRTNREGKIETVAANMPRFDYDPVTKTLKGLLVEESRTNFVINSGGVGKGGWSANGASSIALDSAISPDGTMTASRIFSNTGTSEAYIYHSLTPGGLTTVTLSIYAKQSKAGDKIRLRLFEGGGAQANFTQTSPAVSLTNEWQRVEFTATIQRSDRTTIQMILLGMDNTSEPLVWGGQVESGAFATSYIPTIASQVTRSGDVARVTVGSWYNSIEGTMYVDYNPGKIGVGLTAAGIYMSSANPTQDLVILRNGRGQGNIGGIVIALSALNLTDRQARPFAATGVAVGANVRAAMAFKKDSVAMSVNGGAIALDNTVDMPNPTMFDIGRSTSAQEYANGHIRAVRYFPRRLSDAELQALTA